MNTQIFWVDRYDATNVCSENGRRHGGRARWPCLSQQFEYKTLCFLLDDVVYTSRLEQLLFFSAPIIYLTRDQSLPLQPRMKRRLLSFFGQIVASVLIVFTLLQSFNVFKKQTNLRCIMQMTPGNHEAAGVHSKSSTSNSVFDVISASLYEEAVQPAPRPVDTRLSRRRNFTLDGWERGTGGLDDDDRLALGSLYLNAESVFEFGLGESTLIAASVSVPRYAGVDSDATWVSHTRLNASMDHFRFYFADVGETLWFGYPEDRLKKNEYDYQVQALHSELKPFDVYLVDGRYRVACACLSFLHAIKTGGVMENVRVGVHDSHDITRGYSRLKQVAQVVLQTKRLWVYKLHSDTTEDDLYNLWKKSHHHTK